MRLSLAPSTVLALALSLSAAPAGAVQVQLLSSVPANRASGTATGLSHAMALSADGRWVAFTSNAPNLLPGVVDENGDNDVFLHDRVTGETILVSHSVDDENRTASRASAASSISADGRYLVFASPASDLVPGQIDLGGWDVFLYDRVSRTTELVSAKRGTRTTGANGAVGVSVVSADGRWVVFASTSRELVADTGAGFENLYLWERRTGKVRLITKSTRPPAVLTSNLSSDPSISADGRYVAFLSRVPDLVPGQGETGTTTVNVFLFDRVTGKTAVVDHAASSATVPGDGAASPSTLPRITADGRFVVYASSAKNLIAGQSASGPGSTSNVFLYERATGKNALVSRTVSSPTATAAGFSGTGSPSADGSFILFASTAPNLVAGQVEVPGPPLAVFLYTRSTGKIALVSGAEGSATTPANASSFAVAISGNGDTVLFGSLAWDVVPGVVDENISNDLFVWDRRTGEAELVSHGAASETETAAGAVLLGTIGPLLSNDGKWIAFNSTAPDLVAGVRDANALRDVVLQGRTGGRTLLTRRDPAKPSASSHGESRVSDMSADGRFVVFTSTAADLLPGNRDRNNASDVFVTDRTTGAVTLVSRSAGAPGIPPSSGQATNPRISADGRFVVYESTTFDAVPGQIEEEETTDVFLWDRTTGATVLVSHTAASPLTSGLGLNPRINADGSIVVFESAGQELVPGQVDDNFSKDVFVWERATDTTVLVSRAAGTTATAGDRVSDQPALSADGRFVAFTSNATNLIAGVTGSSDGVFLFDRTAGTTVRVSQGDLGTSAILLSADGRFVAYVTFHRDAILWDRTTGATRLVTHKAGSPTTPAGGVSTLNGISADGRFLAFTSQAPDLVAGQEDSANNVDVFLYDRDTDQSVVVSRAGGPARTAARGGFSPKLSADGRFVAFLSTSADLLSSGTGILSANVFRFDRQTGTVTLASRALAGPTVPANNLCFSPSISADGAVIAFSSFADNLVARDLNRNADGPLTDAFAAVLP